MTDRDETAHPELASLRDPGSDPLASHRPEDEAPPSDSELEGEGPDDHDEIRNLLRGALSRREPSTPELLGAVQRKLRRRSGGKFYADEWSTSRQPPIATYLITSLFMMAVLAVVWAVLSPLSGEPDKVEPPAPVNIISAPAR